MITKWLDKRRERRLAEREQQRIKAESEERALDEKLQERGKELKECLIEVGVIPFNRLNRHLSAKYVTMYGVLNGRLIKAEMGKNGYILINYVGRTP